MNEAYVEHLVARKPNPLTKVLKIVVIALAGLFCAIGFMTLNWYWLVPALVLGIIAYFLLPRLDVEFEYLYLDKEITIDKIFSLLDDIKNLRSEIDLRLHRLEE